MNRETADRYCERGILGLVLAILVWGPLAAGAVRTQELLVLVGLTAAALGLWLVRLWLNERPKLLWPPVSWAVLAFVAYAIGRYFTCDLEYVGRLELLRVLVYAALFFLIVNNLHGQEYTQIIAFTVIFLAMAIAMCAVWQYLARVQAIPSVSALLESVLFGKQTWYFTRIYGERASGTYINPNHLGGLLEMLLPLALAYTLTGRAKPLTKVLLGYAALVILAGIAVTGSRGSWAATGGSLVVFFSLLALHRSYRLPALVMLVVLVGAGIFFVKQSKFFQERMKPTFVDGQVELNVRQELWGATYRMWQDHRWWGVGPGHFDYRFGLYRPPSVQLRPDRAHNEYLNLLADWGVAGAVLIGGVLGALAFGVVKAWRYVRRSEREFRSNRSNKFALVIGAVVGLVALLGHSLVDFNLQIPANAALAATLAALLSSHLRFATERVWVGQGLVLKGFVSLVLLAVASVLALQTMRLAREYVWLERAAAKGNYSPEKAAALERAYAIEPNNFETAFAVAESYRTQSFEGGHEFEGQEGYEQLAQRAMLWYSRGTNANRFDGYNYLGYGRCLDLLGRTNESPAFFARADELDPNNYFIAAHIGRHYVERADFGAARRLFERSLRLQKEDNKVASDWLERLNQVLSEAAKGGVGR